MNWLITIKKQHASLLAVFAVVLLCAQVSSLTHGVDHYQHGDQELCSSFISFESQSADLAFVNTVPQYFDAAIIATSYQWHELPQVFARHGLTRAPPFPAV